MNYELKIYFLRHRNLGFFVFFCILLYNANAQTMSLDVILNTIEQNNPELKIYDAKIKANDAYASGAKAFEAPRIGTGFFMTPYNPTYWKSSEHGDDGMGSFMISAEQMIMNPKKLDAMSGYMQSMSGMDKEMKNYMRNEMFSMAKMNYYEWIVMQKKLQIIKESESLLEYLIQSTELRYVYGMDKLSSYYKAKAMLGDMQRMRIMIESEIKQKMIALNTMMNQDKETSFNIDTVYTIKNYDVALHDTTSLSSVRSDYKTINQNINMLRSKQLYEQSKQYPDFGLRYDHMFAFGKQPQQFSLMFMASIPIAPWSSKAYKANISGLSLEMESLKNKQQSILNNTDGEVHLLKEQIKSKKEQLSLYEKSIIPSMKKNYESMLIAYEQNTEELAMTIDAAQNLKTVRISYLDQLMELLMLQVKYEKELEIKN